MTAERPQVAAQLLRVLARQRRTNNDLANLILTDVPGRVAKQLLALGQGFGTEQDGGLRVTHDLTQVEIASWSGRRGNHQQGARRFRPAWLDPPGRQAY